MSTAERPAVFLDRDGTLNELVWHEEYGEWGPPWSEAELVLKPGAADLIRDLRAVGYVVFVVTNQPDAAKGKATLAALSDVERAFNERISAEGAKLDGYEQCLRLGDKIILVTVIESSDYVNVTMDYGKTDAETMKRIAAAVDAALATGNYDGAFAGAGNPS